jgi:hypothetical protein
LRLYCWLSPTLRSLGAVARSPSTVAGYIRDGAQNPILNFYC